MVISAPQVTAWLSLSAPQVTLWLISVCPTGNGGVLAYRLLVDRGGALPGFRVLVMNLCVSDGLMGVYLLLIGVADAGYRGVYVSIDTQWRHSVMCRAAGFLALVSSEVTLILLSPGPSVPVCLQYLILFQSAYSA